MKSVIIHNWLKDPFTEISVSTSPTPNIENLPSNAVLVAVKHTALNFFDILLVKGQYQIRPPFPFVPGSEFSGIVIGVGKDIKQDQFKIGDAVFGSSPNGLGAYATHTIVPLDKSRPPTLYRLPPELTLKQGATLYYTYPTAWAGLFLRARLKENEVVLVHGGAGGVAVAAIQFAKSVPGTKVIATCRGGEESMKGKFLKEQLGVDAVLDYTDFVGKMKETLKKLRARQVDVVFDPVGLVNDSLKVIGWNGRIVVVGFAGRKNGEMEEVAMNKILLKNCEITGVFWGEYARREQHRLPEAWSAIFNLFRTTPYRPIICDKEYRGLYSIRDGLRDLYERKVYGKVVVDVTEEESNEEDVRAPRNTSKL